VFPRRCLLGRCIYGCSKNRRFGRTHRLHLQGNDSLESSQLAATICLTTDSEESVIHSTPQSILSVTVKIECRTIASSNVLVSLCIEE
jgi:hypothetical protein